MDKNRNIIEQHAEAVKKKLSSLDAKREALKSEEILVKYLTGVVPDIPQLPMIITRDSKVDFILFEVESLETAARIINGLPATNETSEYNATTRSAPTVIDSPYKIDIENSVKGASDITLWWTHGEYRVWLKIPASLFAGTDFFMPERRPVSDSEYHYFVGVSMEELRKIRIPCLTFGRGMVTRFYGGNRRQDSGCAADEIADYIKQHKRE